MIEVSHLTRRFGSLLALDDVSFTVSRGEVVGFLGPNGAGKTTAMRILSGYLAATSGAARVAGFDVLRESLQVRSRIGYLPESVPLYREHRVVELCEFHARLHALPRELMRRRIPEVLERVGLKERSRDIVGTLSRGLRQRVGLALALLPAPEVLILDEPTSGLDPLQRIEVRTLLSELAHERTVLLSSHILPEIEAVCPRVIILHQGRIAADGTRDALVEQLAGASHVRLEAFVGLDLEHARRWLGSLSGVREVRDLGRAGIHQQFEIVCTTDLREDVGALCAAKGWAVRELSWRRASLEQVFTRIALGLDPAQPVSAVAAPAAVHGEPIGLEVNLQRAGAPAECAPATSVPPAPAAGSAPAPPGKLVYNLNPFDKGASRDLGRPKPQ